MSKRTDRVTMAQIKYHERVFWVDGDGKNFKPIKKYGLGAENHNLFAPDLLAPGFITGNHKTPSFGIE